MNIVRRTIDTARGILKRYGPSYLKRTLWDHEFSGTHWNFIDTTIGDCVYPYLERHINNGRILDLGCGPGNTANELAASSYQLYLGVDISCAALRKATQRSRESGRASKNCFIEADFIDYVPQQKFDVILFRESLYHVPLNKVKPTFDRYDKYLVDGGVFIVRLKTLGSYDSRTKSRPRAMLDIIVREFDVLEKGEHGDLGSMVVVFRRRRSISAAVGEKAWETSYATH